MEPFEYDDYSDFDAEELDFDPPPRVSARRNVRQVSPFDLEGMLSNTEFIASKHITRLLFKKTD